LPAGQNRRKRIRRLRTEVHALVVRRAAIRRPRHPAVSLPRGILRSLNRTPGRRPAAPPARARAARDRQSRGLRRRRRGADDVSIGRPFTRDQRTTIVHGMLAFVLMLVVLQLWLLTSTMNAYLGGDESVIWPAAAVSLACLMLKAGLRRYLYRIAPTRR